MAGLSVVFLAGRNLGQKMARSALLFLAFALIAAMIFGMTVLLQGVDRGLTRGMARLGADVMVVPAEAEFRARRVLMSGEPSSFTMDRAIVDSLARFPGVGRLAPQLFIVSANLSCCAVGNTQLVAYDPENDFTIQPWLAGRDREALESDEVIVGSEIAFLPGTSPRFFGMPVRVAGRLEPTGLEFVDRTVFIPVEGARRMIENSARDAEIPLEVDPDAVSAVMIRADAMAPGELAIRIESEFEGVRALVSSELVTNVRRDLRVALRTLTLASGGQWLVTLALVGLVYGVTLNERRRELGILRALGATRRALLRLLLLEVSVLSLSGALSGVVAAWILLVSSEGLIRMAWDLPFLWPGTGSLVVTGAAATVGVLACALFSTAWPVIRTVRMEPYEAVRKGE